MPDPNDVTYEGLRPAGAGGGVITIVDSAGMVIGVVRHVPKHSPTGMQWGYGGSGAADCARSLLLAAIGDDAARCPTCAGRGRVAVLSADDDVPFDPMVHSPDQAMGCLDCDGDGVRALPYQDFKFAFVAGWGDRWSMTRSAILTWLEHAGVKLDNAPGGER